MATLAASLGRRLAVQAGARAGAARAACRALPVRAISAPYRQAAPLLPGGSDARSAGAAPLLPALAKPAAAELWRCYLRSLEARPLLTKALTSFCLTAISDSAAQLLGGAAGISLARVARLALYSASVGGLVGGLAGGRSSPGDGARHGIRTPRLCRPPPSTPCRPCCAQARRTLCQLRAGGGRRACRRRQRARGRHCCPQPRHVVHHRGTGECTGGGAAEARAPDHVRRRGGGRAGAGRRRGALGAQPGREARAQVGGRAGWQAGAAAGAVAVAPRQNIIPPWSHAAQRSSCSCSSARSVGRLAMSSARLAARPAGRGTACFRSLTWRCAWWWST